MLVLTFYLNSTEWQSLQCKNKTESNVMVNNVDQSLKRGYNKCELVKF